MFTYMSTSWVGSMHDAHVFQNSSLAVLVERGCFTPGVADLQLGTIVVPPLLIRDLAYLLLP